MYKKLLFYSQHICQTRRSTTTREVRRERTQPISSHLRKYRYFHIFRFLAAKFYRGHVFDHFFKTKEKRKSVAEEM